MSRNCYVLVIWSPGNRGGDYWTDDSGNLIASLLERPSVSLFPDTVLFRDLIFSLLQLLFPSSSPLTSSVCFFALKHVSLHSVHNFYAFLNSN